MESLLSSPFSNAAKDPSVRPASCKLSDLALPIGKPSRELRRVQTSKVPPGKAKTGVCSSFPIECKPVSNLEGLLSTAEVVMSLISSPSQRLSESSILI